MKKQLLLLALLLCATVGFSQTTFTKDNIVYKVTSTNPNTVEVTVSKDASGDVVIPDTVTNGNTEYSVTAIGDTAFNFNKLTSVKIGDNVITIGNYAFSNNYFLANVNIGNNVKTIGEGAFSNNNLTSVTIPNSVTAIGGYAFYFNNRLTSVTIGTNVTTIGDSAFLFCDLTSVTIPSSVTAIGESAFEDNQLMSVVIPDNVKTIGDFAFANNGLTSVESKGNTPPTIGIFSFGVRSGIALS